MRRGVIALDRVVGVAVALVLIAAGVAAVYWWHTDTPATITLETPPDRTSATWWPWATGTAGAALTLGGFWWLTRHLPRRLNGRFTLPSSGKTGRLFADAHAAVDAAASDLSGLPEIRDASGRVVADRGELVAEIQCTIEPSAELTAVHSAVTRAAADLHSVLGLPHLRHRVRLRVARGDKTTAIPRVI
ncbi:hypothetical protein ACWEOO_34810 [Kribbella sp. NPDC004138]